MKSWLATVHRCTLTTVRMCGLAFALLLPFVFLFCLSAEIWLRFTTNLPFVSRTHCFTQNALEAPGFLPNCEELLKTPGGTIRFHTNEDGFRDRPRNFFSRGAIAILGDSYVEGFWLSEEKGLTRALERAWNPPYPLLNLGIRASGPSQQAIRLYRAWEHYPLRAAIWVLNPSDPIDELNFQAQNPGFTISRNGWIALHPLWNPPRSYWAWTNLSLALHDKIYLLLYVAEKWIKQKRQAAVISSATFSEETHCRSLRLVAEELKAKRLQLLFLAMPHGRTASPRPYFGGTVNDELFERLLSCARGTGAKVLDLRRALEGPPEWYWRNDWHYNESGVEAVAALAAPQIAASFEWKGKP